MKSRTYNNDGIITNLTRRVVMISRNRGSIVERDIVTNKGQGSSQILKWYEWLEHFYSLQHVKGFALELSRTGFEPATESVDTPTYLPPSGSTWVRTKKLIANFILTFKET